MKRRNENRKSIGQMLSSIGLISIVAIVFFAGFIVAFSPTVVSATCWWDQDLETGEWIRVCNDTPTPRPATATPRPRATSTPRPPTAVPTRGRPRRLL